MRRVAATLIGAGVVFWVLGVIAWVAGVWVTLPPDAVRVLVLTLAALAGGVLLAAGAAVGRAAQRFAAAAGAADMSAPADGAGQAAAAVDLPPNQSLQLPEARTAPTPITAPTPRLRS